MSRDALLSYYYAGQASRGSGIVPVQRAPLPPFDGPQPPDYIPVATKLPANQIIPAKPDPRWPRANWFSVTMPGLPWVSGLSTLHPDMVYSWFLQRWDKTWQENILTAHAQRFYTHYMLSWPDARRDGLSEAQFVQLALKVQAFCPFVHVMLASKADAPGGAGWDQIKAFVEPVLRALIKAKAVAMVSLWETSLWCGAGKPVQSMIDNIAAICVPEGVDQWFHSAVENVWWGATDFLPNREQWWEYQIGKLVGVLYQGDVEWSPGLRQAHIQDTTDKPSAAPRFADGTFRLCAAEMDGMKTLNSPFITEDICDLHGFEMLCTPGKAPVYGFCDGARMPDGRPI